MRRPVTVFVALLCCFAIAAVNIVPSLPWQRSAVSQVGSWAVVVGGQSNNAGATFAVTVGGQNNSDAQTYGFIGGGANNTNTGLFGFIGGGLLNSVCCDESVVVGGSGNTNIGAHHSVIVGGQDHYMNCEWAFIGGGQLNRVDGAADCETIVGGKANIIDINNVGGGDWSFIGAGRSNQINGAASVIAGGFLGENDGNFSFIGAGQSNLIAGGTGGSIVGGVQNKVTANGAHVLGQQGTNANPNSILLSANFTSQLTVSNGAVAANVPIYSQSIGSATNVALLGLWWNSTALGTNLNALSTLSNLITVNIPGNMLTNNGDAVEWEDVIQLANSQVGSNEFTVVHGAVTMADSGLLSMSNSVVYIKGRLRRTGNAAGQFTCSMNFGAGSAAHAFTNFAKIDTQNNGIANSFSIKGATSAGPISAHTNLDFQITYLPASR